MRTNAVFTKNKPSIQIGLFASSNDKLTARCLKGYYYYATEVNDPDDNPPIGIILCTDKDSVTAEYALGGLTNHIFASRYVVYMPNKEQLIKQIEVVLDKWHKEKGETD